MAAITIYSDFGAQKNKVSHCFHCFPIYVPWSDGTGCHDLSHFIAHRWGNSGNCDRLFIFGLQNHCRWWLQPWNLKALAPWKKSYDQCRQHIKRQRHYFANKCPSSQSYGFSSSHVWMWELDYKESWATEELMLLNCGVGEDSWESLGLSGDQTSPF